MFAYGFDPLKLVFTFLAFELIHWHGRTSSLNVTHGSVASKAAWTLHSIDPGSHPADLVGSGSDGGYTPPSQVRNVRYRGYATVHYLTNLGNPDQIAAAAQRYMLKPCMKQSLKDM
jgi:hypothetical protein